MSRRSHATEVSAAEVLKSLPPKARKIFAILVAHTQDKDGPGGELLCKICNIRAAV